MSDIDIFIEENNNSKKKLENILKEKDIHNQIYKLENLLKENNTEPEIVLKYLKLKQEIQDKNLPELLDTYKDCIFYETFNKEFGKIKTKTSFIQKIKELFGELKTIWKEKDVNKKTEIILKIIKKENKKYKQTFPLFISINKELYFNSLYYRFLKNLKREYNDSIKNNKYDYFKSYMNNLSSFIYQVINDFLALFEKNDIFLLKNFDDKQKNNINLFSDFISFLINYKFIDRKGLHFYIGIWKDSFKHVTFEELNYKSSDEQISFEKIEGNLKVKIGIDDFDEYEIKNIENYKLSSLLGNITDSKGTPIDFTLDNYLRIDKYDSQLYITKNWSILSNYFVKILTSDTIQSLIKVLYPNDTLFLDEKLMANILKNIRFFNFDTDFIGETKKRFLSIYIQSFPPKKNKNDKLKKIIYLAVVLITCFHEILGHLFIRIHNYLNKNNFITSPKPQFGSSYAQKRGKESGENVEELLFGNYKCEITLNQILFILDKNNYSVNYSKFRTNFETISNNATLENISDELKYILRLYEIKIENSDMETKELYFVGKYNKEEKIIIEIPPQHSMKKLLQKIDSKELY